MPKSSWRAWRSFLRADGGNVAILFGLTAIPLILLLGGAVDFARFLHYRTELANAVDATALALARRGESYTDQEATTYVETYLTAFDIEDSQFTIGDVSVVKTDGGFRVDADGTMDTIFLPLGKYVGDGESLTTLDVDIVAEVVSSSNRIELALVLDNTGSMNCGAVVASSCTGRWSNPGESSRIAGLKRAAHKLLDVLMTDDAIEKGFIKVGVVPFEGAVNIRNAALDDGWLDWNDVGTAAGNGANFSNYDIDTGNNPCTTTTTPGYYTYDWRGRRTWHPPETNTTCTETKEKVGHKWLFDQLHADDSSVSWAGCVEMRASPYDVSDTPPASSDPDTLFVPFFWPDEPDDDNDDNDYYSNNYLDDDTSSNGSGAQRNTAKYLTSNVSWQRNKKDTSFPYESGPNYGCPRPLLPLTSDRDSVEDAIDDMIAYPAMGTFIPTGLAWGWRVLSPEAPFTEGIAPGQEHYETTVKALVLLSDGENSVTAASNHNKSIFSGYNYVNTQVSDEYPLGSNDASTAQDNLNTKTSTLCTNVKAAGIRLYTITFGDIPGSARTLMRNCASVDRGESLYYHAPSNSELEGIFYSIGQDLAEIHLSM